VLCLDYRGRGLSARDPDWQHYEPITYINDAFHVLAAAGVHRVILVGTSLGGILSMAIAALRPTLVAAVVLNDIGPDVDRSGLKRIVDFIGTDRPQPDWEAAERFMRTALAHLPIKDDGIWRRLTRGTFREGADRLLHFDWDVNLVKPLLRNDEPERDLWALYRGLRNIPVLALRGAVSDVLGVATFDRMAAEKPDLVRVTVADAGHVPSFEEPEARAALDDFFARF
jgi:pimeloyl-ACP methyl ester carboxylesterase